MNITARVLLTALSFILGMGWFQGAVDFDAAAAEPVAPASKERSHQPVEESAEALNDEGSATREETTPGELFRNEQANFSLMLPRRPAMEQTDNGLVFQLVTGAEWYLVTYIPDQPIPQQRTKTLIEFRDRMVKAWGGTLISDTPIRWGGHHGRRYAFSYRDQRVPFNKVQVVYSLLVEDAWYYVVYGTIDFARDLEFTYSQASKVAAAQFDSFRLLTPVKATAKTEPEVLDGSWTVVSAARDGKDASAILKGDELTFYNGSFSRLTTDELAEGSPPFWKGRYRTDAQTSPHEIDIELSRDFLPSPRGIYRIDDGDRLHLCYRDSDAGRPQAFDSPAGSQTTLLVLKRPER